MATWLTSGRGLATIAGTIILILITTAVVWNGRSPDPEIQAQQPVLVTDGVKTPLQKAAPRPVRRDDLEQVVPTKAVGDPTPEKTTPPEQLAAATIAEQDGALAKTAVDTGAIAPVQTVAPPAKDTQAVQPDPVRQKTESTDQTAALTPVSGPKTTPKITPQKTESKPVPVVTNTVPDVVDSPARPVLDLLRVDAQGGAIVAGTAKPGATVRIRLGDETLQSVRADANGSFVALLDLPTSTAPRPLVLEGIEGGKAVPSAETVLVMPFAGDNRTAPKLVLANAQGVTILQDETVQEVAPEITTQPAPVVADVQGVEFPAAVSLPQIGATVLSLDTIAYDKTGDVVLVGRGQSDQEVRVYLNNKPIQTETVRSDGQWQVVLPEIREGVHTLRVDATDPAGKVSARVESPFKREIPEVAAAAADQGSVTVQPGHTLWALAQGKYGDGLKYVQIFQANRDRIRNPDLIYPGQVFELPK